MANTPSVELHTQHDEAQHLVGQQACVHQLDDLDDQPVSPISDTSISRGHHAARPQYVAAPVEKSSTPPPTIAGAKNNTSFIRSLSRTAWLTEILSCVLALAALAAIVITLATHQDRTLPRWPSLISINSLIAIFTAIFKAAMLLPIAEGLSELKWIWFAASRPLTDMDRFDSASRGPWGSFLLFFMRPNLLAYLGALITVVALAIDPFTQQILQYYECFTPLPDISASIVRTNVYSTAGLHTGAGEASLDGPMAAALYQGVLAPPTNATASIAFECTSGNCTFPASESVSYSSLAMCTSVEDISHSITGNGTFYYHTLPSGLYTQTSTLFSSGGGGIGDTSHAPLFTYEAIMINCKSPRNETTGTCAQTGPWAFRATLYLCVHTYGNVQISKSVLQEQKLSTTRVPFMNMSGGLYFSLAGDYPSFPGLDCSPNETPEGNKTIPTSLLHDDVRYVNRSTATIGAPDTLYFDPACTYEFGQGPILALTAYLATVFFGLYSDPNTLQAPYGSPDNTVGSAWLERLYANGTASLSSVSDFMEGLSNTMTATMRQRGDASNSVSAIGTVLGNTTCIRVRWRWLSLPVALSALTMAFFVAVVVTSKRYTRKSAAQAGRRPWVSSSLPLLWCGLDDETKRKCKTLDDLKGMGDYGDQVRVKLARTYDEKDGDGGRWVLQEAGGGRSGR